MASIIEKINSTMVTDHPYWPVELQIASYVANEISYPILLAYFSGICALILFATLTIVNYVHPNLKGTDKATIWWFVLSGSIHMFLEGYFSINHKNMGPAQDLLGQLWKEYALSDSRYLVSDPFVLCMETITAFIWGPMCFIVAAFITVDHPLRHPLQIIVSGGQVYGLVLYYATSMFDHYYRGVSYSRPEFLYFWVYYFFINFIWAIFPTILLVSSVNKCKGAFQALQKMEKTLHSNGVVKTTKKTN